MLKHIDVTIPAGQQVAIVGSTGSGKTTLGRLIARFADPTIGAIELGGVPLRRVDRAELRRRLDRRVAGAVPVRRFDQRQRRFAVEHSTTGDVERVVDELGVRDWVDSLSEAWPPASASAATSCRQGNVSWWRCCAPASPGRTC